MKLKRQPKRYEVVTKGRRKTLFSVFGDSGENTVLEFEMPFTLRFMYLDTWPQLLLLFVVVVESLGGTTDMMCITRGGLKSLEPIPTSSLVGECYQLDWRV